MRSAIDLYKEIFAIIDEYDIDTKYVLARCPGRNCRPFRLNTPLGIIAGLLLSPQIEDIAQEYIDNRGVRSHVAVNARLFDRDHLYDRNSPSLNAIAKVGVTFSGLMSVTTSSFDTFGSKVCFPLYLIELLHLLRPLLLRGMAILVPDSERKDDSVEDDEMHSWRHIADTFLPKRLDVLNIEKIETLRKKRNRPVNWSSNLPSLSLPTLRGLTIEELVKVREDSQGSFAIYQAALKEFVRGVRRKNLSDKDLCALLDGVTVGVIRCEEAYRAILRRHKFSSLDVGLGVIGTSLLLAGPLEWKAYVAAILGTKTLSDGAKWFISKSHAKQDLKGSEFWFPWHLARQSKDLVGMT